MITGFNTDVSYEGTTYHVQTEDKGESNPIIESLVYVRGAILVAKRSSYAKELQIGLVEEQLQGMLEKQHRTILAVIKAGRIQELVERLKKQQSAESGSSHAAPVMESQAAAPPVPQVPAPTPPAVQPVAQPVAQPAAQQVAQQAAQPAAEFNQQYDHYEAPKSTEAEPVATPAAGSGFRTSGSLEGHNKGDSQPLFAEFDLDKIIFDYLQTDAQEEKLEISLLGNADFYAGEAVLLQIEVSRGGIQPLPSVPVIVKVIGTAFKPQIYSGRTGADGVAIIPVNLPNFTAGSAAIVVQSSSEAGEAEVKHLIRRR